MTRPIRPGHCPNCGAPCAPHAYCQPREIIEDGKAQWFKGCESLRFDKVFKRTNRGGHRSAPKAWKEVAE